MFAHAPLVWPSPYAVPCIMDEMGNSDQRNGIDNNGEHPGYAIKWNENYVLNNFMLCLKQIHQIIIEVNWVYHWSDWNDLIPILFLLVPSLSIKWIPDCRRPQSRCKWIHNEFVEIVFYFLFFNTEFMRCFDECYSLHSNVIDFKQHFLLKKETWTYLAAGCSFWTRWTWNEHSLFML